MLPRDWIAIVCGIASAKDGTENELAEDLPPNFYVMPSTAYVPELTAVSDVVLGKLVGRPRGLLSAHKATEMMEYRVTERAVKLFLRGRLSYTVSPWRYFE